MRTITTGRVASAVKVNIRPELRLNNRTHGILVVIRGQRTRRQFVNQGATRNFLRFMIFRLSGVFQHRTQRRHNISQVHIRRHTSLHTPTVRLHIRRNFNKQLFTQLRTVTQRINNRRVISTRLTFILTKCNRRHFNQQRTHQMVTTNNQQPATSVRGAPNISSFLNRIFANGTRNQSSYVHITVVATTTGTTELTVLGIGITPETFRLWPRCGTPDTPPIPTGTTCGT